MDDSSEDATDDRSSGDENDEQTNTYECNDCGNRMQAAHQPEICPNCGGGMIDISVSRE